MSNAVTWMNQFAAQIAKTNADILALQGMAAQAAADPTLITRYFATPPAPNGQAQARSDITAQDVTNALNALATLITDLTSGSPTVISYFLKMMP